MGSPWTSGYLELSDHWAWTVLDVASLGGGRDGLLKIEYS